MSDENTTSDAGAPRKSVRRPPASATWEHEHRWGSMIGDVTALRVTRTDGGSLSIRYENDSIEVRESLVEVLAQMVALAAEWSDDKPPCPDVDAHVGGEDA